MPQVRSISPYVTLGILFLILVLQVMRYERMFKHLNKYFNPVVKALPKLHKLNIDTAALEKEMKILKKFVNQPDLIDRMKIGRIYYNFYYVVMKKVKVSFTWFHFLFFI